MGFYEDFVNGLKGSVGEGKAFEKNVDMAEFLGKPPAYTHRLMSGDRGKTLESVGKLLDKLGAKLIFPDELPPPPSIHQPVNTKCQNCEALREEIKRLTFKIEGMVELASAQAAAQSKKENEPRPPMEVRPKRQKS